MLDRKTARERFHALGREREKKLAVSVPLRAKLAELRKESEAKEAALNKQIKAAEEGLFDIDVERGMLARALGGQTGEPK